MKHKEVRQTTDHRPRPPAHAKQAGDQHATTDERRATNDPRPPGDDLPPAHCLLPTALPPPLSRPPAPLPPLASLHDSLTARKSLEELRDLCLRLGVDYDSLPGEGKRGRIRELLLLMARQGRLEEISQIQDTTYDIRVQRARSSRIS